VRQLRRVGEPDIPAGFHDPVTSDVPVMTISGPYDPVTPPRFAEQVAAHLSHAVQVVVPDGHHGEGGLSHEECITGVTAAFIDRAGGGGLDTSCVATMARPPFVTDEAHFTAFLQGAD
jgi:pimeloyl-ACP methyl ester carboxylesterase